MENFEFKNSSNIKSASYDVDTKDMTIIFKNGKIVHNKRIDWNETLNLWERDKESFEEKRLVRYDSKYVYRDIPVDLYKKFTEAESAGKFFYSNIRNHYKYSKM